MIYNRKYFHRQKISYMYIGTYYTRTNVSRARTNCAYVVVNRQRGQVGEWG